MANGERKIKWRERGKTRSGMFLGEKIAARGRGQRAKQSKGWRIKGEREKESNIVIVCWRLNKQAGHGEQKHSCVSEGVTS